MTKTNKHFHELRDYLGTIPVIDCHDHTQHVRPKYSDAIHALFNNYVVDDLTSASSEEVISIIFDSIRSLEERWPYLENAWKKTRFTGFARPTKLVLKHFYDQDELTLDALKQVQKDMLDLQDDAVFEDILVQANIVSRLEDICFFEPHEIKNLLNGTYKVPPRSLPVITLPWFHEINSYESVQTLCSNVDKTAISLDDYLEICREIFENYKCIGSVAFKDQSAYKRSLNYENPNRAKAEHIFNWFMEDPRRTASYPDEVKPLDDYLFHEFMGMARDMDLPVQIHTGHIAGIRNDITKANAVQLIPVLELHRDVRFDLFHLNWPYSGELLFLAKNYPNVSINFCWTHIIDPVYCQRMTQQIISSVPHGKVHAFGADYAGNAEFAWAHLQIAKDNIAIGLSELVEMGYMDLKETKDIAFAWFYENPKEFYRLDL
jgi:hypothetical protein